MALTRWELTDIELCVRQAVEAGHLAEPRVARLKHNEPAQGATSTAAPTIRARLLMELLTRAIPTDGASLRGVKLRGVRITEVLDLSLMTLTCPLLLQDCYLDEPINLREAQAPAIRLPGCHVPGLYAHQVKVAGNLELNNGFTAKGEVQLTGAKIGGQLNCSGGHFTNHHGPALNAYQLTVDGDVNFRDGFAAVGEVRLTGAQIAGWLNCDGARLINPNGRALNCYQLTVGRDVYFKDGFAAVGEVHLSGAHITGSLDCSDGHFINLNPDRPAIAASALTVGQSIRFQKGFTSEGQVNLFGARIGGHFNCGGASLKNGKSKEPALNAASVAVDQDMHCKALKVEGEVRLTGARIGGQLNCSGGELANDHPGGRALNASQLTVGQDVYFRDGFAAVGEVQLTGAQITGSLNCDGARLINPHGRALNGYQLTVGRDVYLKDGFAAMGEVHLSGAQITGSLSCNDGHFINLSAYKPAIMANALRVGQSVRFQEGFLAKGEVNLVSAQIEGQLNCNGATFINPNGRALNAYRLTVARDVFCKEGFAAKGEVHFNGAQIRGSLNCSGGSFTNPKGRAIDAYGLTVVDLFCKGETGKPRKRFRAVGEVHLSGAHITGSLNCSGGHFTNHHSNRRALNAYSLTVDQDVFFEKGFIAEGEVNLVGARISGRLSCLNGRFGNQNGDALNLAWASATILIFRPRKRPNGAVRLANARIGSLDDDPKTWPEKLYLRGFVYDSLKNERVTVKDRCRALKELDPERYSPQPYEQLAAVYRRAGAPEAARQVLIAKQQARRERLRWHGKAWSLILGALVGHGYRTWFAAIWLLGSVVVGWWVFDLAHPTYLIASKPPHERPLFHAGLYTLDLVLPVGDLNYQGAWIARGWARTCWLAWIMWGWVLTTVVIAGLAGLGKRD